MSLSPLSLSLPLFSLVRKYNNNPFSLHSELLLTLELGSLWAAPTKKGPSTLVCVNGIPFRLRRSVKGFFGLFRPGSNDVVFGIGQG